VNPYGSLWRTGAASIGVGVSDGAAPAGIAGTAVRSDRERFRILYVCTGNICRSPIAERLTRHELRQRLGARGSRDILVESAGTWGHEGAGMEGYAATVLADYGAPSEGFHGRELLEEHVAEADLVLTSTRDHRSQVVSMGFSAGLRTFTIKEFTRLVGAIDAATLPDGDVVDRAASLVRAAAALRGWLLAADPGADEIIDPYGAPLTVFRHIGEEIYSSLDPVLTALTGVRGS
jgi:protein-tyrosine phosphatase